MRKLRTLTLLPMIVLSSCAKNNYVGTYQFRLGKTDGSHLELTAVLTKEKYNDNGMKKMTLTADLGEEMSPTTIIQQYGDKYPILEPFVDIIIEEIKDIHEIPFYYQVLNSKLKKYGNRVAIGTDFVLQKVDELKAKYPAIKDILDTLGIDDSKFVLNPDQIKYFLGSYVNSSILTFEIPVSTDDLTMQTFWYGKSRLVDGDYLDKLPGTKGEERFGTHPQVKKDHKGNIIVDECAEVNKTFEKEFSNTHLYIQDGEYNKKIGSFVEGEVDGKKTVKCYLSDSYTGTHQNIEGFIYSKDLEGDFTLKQNIKLSINDDSSTNLTYKDATGRDQAFIDENGKEFRFIDVMQDPFEFRDFHTVDLGLTKI